MKKNVHKFQMFYTTSYLSIPFPMNFRKYLCIYELQEGGNDSSEIKLERLTLQRM